MPILMAIAPLVLAVVMVVGFGGNLSFLGFALLSRVMVIGNYLTDRRSGRRSYRQRRTEYTERKAALENEAKAGWTCMCRQSRCTASRRPMEAAVSGWPEIDYDPAVWIELPRIWCEETWPDHRAWARDVAEEFRLASGLVPGEHAVDNLALTLAMYAEKLESGELPAQDFFLHLPDPRMMPPQVCRGVWDAEGERDAALRVLTGADDPEAVEPPVAERFATEHLGEGLRTLRYYPFDPGPDHPPAPGAIYGALNYAWRVDEYDTDVRLFTSCPDIARLIQIVDDVDTLARGIRIVAA